MNKLTFFVLVCALAAVAYAQTARKRIDTVYRKEILVPSGAYTSNFTTANGIRVVEQGHLEKNAKGEDVVVKQGNFAYTSPEGTPVSLSYIADQFGARFVGDVIPVAPRQ